MARLIPSCSKKQHIVVELRKSDYELRLQNDIKALRQQVESLKHQVDVLTIRYGAEVQYNAALCDLLKLHSIPYRHVFEHSFRYCREDEKA